MNKFMIILNIRNYFYDNPFLGLSIYQDILWKALTVQGFFIFGHDDKRQEAYDHIVTWIKEVGTFRLERISLIPNYHLQ